MINADKDIAKKKVERHLETVIAFFAAMYFCYMALLLVAAQCFTT